MRAFEIERMDSAIKRAALSDAVPTGTGRNGNLRAASEIPDFGAEIFCGFGALLGL